jgi:hypothetical protein
MRQAVALFALLFVACGTVTSTKGRLVGSVTSSPDPGATEMRCESGEVGGVRCTALNTDCGPSAARIVRTTNSEGEQRLGIAAPPGRRCRVIQWRTYEATPGGLKLKYEASGSGAVSVMLPVASRWTLIEMAAVLVDGVKAAYQWSRKDHSTGPAEFHPYQPGEIRPLVFPKGDHP